MQQSNSRIMRLVDEPLLRIGPTVGDPKDDNSNDRVQRDASLKSIKCAAWIRDSVDCPCPISQAKCVADEKNSKDQRKGVCIRLHQDADDTEPDDLQGDDQKPRHEHQCRPYPDIPRTIP